MINDLPFRRVGTCSSLFGGLYLAIRGRSQMNRQPILLSRESKTPNQKISPLKS
jgi:hypothetical protein